MSRYPKLVVLVAKSKAKAEVKKTGIDDYRHKCTKSVAGSRSEEAAW